MYVWTARRDLSPSPQAAERRVRGETFYVRVQLGNNSLLLSPESRLLSVKQEVSSGAACEARFSCPLIQRYTSLRWGRKISRETLSDTQHSAAISKTLTLAGLKQILFSKKITSISSTYKFISQWRYSPPFTRLFKPATQLPYPA